MKFIAAKHIIPFTLLLLIVFSFTVQTARAMSPFDLIVLEADGLSFQVFDAEFLDFYAFGFFQDSPIEKPVTTNDGVLITRYTPVDGVYIQPYDQMIYYTSTDGSGGYVYYIGTTNGSSKLDQKWYRGNVQAEALIKSKFESYEKDLSLWVTIALFVFAGLITLILLNARK
jgi:hypothetical protein